MDALILLKTLPANVDNVWKTGSRRVQPPATAGTMLTPQSPTEMLYELANGQTSFLDYGQHQAALELPYVPRHRNRPGQPFPPHHGVASTLANHMQARSFQGPHHVSW